jgi:arylsulfatase A-like enzyme/Tfp pilus assembly protein PilF
MKILRILFCFCSLLVVDSSQAFDNVLLISVDTLRSDYISASGSKKVSTPNIDGLAKSGVLFKNAVSPTPFTLPSHISLLTGLIPPAHKVHDNIGFYLNDSVTTIAEVLASRGWKTGAFIGAFPLDSRFGMDQGFQIYDDKYPTATDSLEFSIPERNAEQIANSALAWLQKQGSQKWFAFIHFYDPHFPYIAPEPFRKQYGTNLYAAEVAYVDAQVGRILTFIKDKKLSQKTLIIFTSDHGEALGDHGEKTHGIFAYESTLRIPLIVSPFAAKAVETRVRLIDVTPTILDLLQLSTPQKTQGVSLKSYLQTKESLPPKDSYFEALSMHLNAQWAPLRGIYSGKYKYIHLPLPELYDLSADPGETKNLCQQQKLCGQYRKSFDAFYRAFERDSISPAVMDAETREKLQALGYLTGPSGPKKENYGPDDDPKNLISIQNRMDEAVVFFHQGLDLKAMEVLDKIIAENPKHMDAYLYLAFIRSAQGFPDKSVELLQKAKRNGLASSQLEGRLGLYLFQMRRFDDAVQQLKKAVEMDGRNLENLNYLGLSYSASEKYKQAEEAFRRALQVDPSDARTLNNLGALHLAQKNFKTAEEFFLKAVQSNEHSGAYNSLGVIYAEQKKLDLAIKNWLLAIQKNRQNYEAVLNLAFAYMEINQKKKALDLFRYFEKNAPPAQYRDVIPQVRSLIRDLQKT